MREMNTGARPLGPQSRAVGVGAGQVGFGPATAAPATAPRRNPVKPEEGALRVLWVSKHKPLREEERQLRLYASRLGKELEFEKHVGIVPSAEWLLRSKILADGYDIVVAVLPLTMTAHLLELGREYGFEVWRPKMELLHTDKKYPCPQFRGDTDVMSPTTDPDGNPVFAHRRFVHFERLIEVQLVTEPVEVA
jgi:hypothetical protein